MQSPLKPLAHTILVKGVPTARQTAHGVFGFDPSQADRTRRDLSDLSHQLLPLLLRTNLADDSHVRMCTPGLTIRN